MKHSRSSSKETGDPQCRREQLTNDLLQVVARERKRLRLEAIKNTASHFAEFSNSIGPLLGKVQVQATPVSAALAEATSGTPSKVPKLTHIRIEDDEDDGSTLSDEDDTDDTAFCGSKKSPLFYKSYDLWVLPPTSANIKMGEHWTKISRPLALPPRLPTCREATRSVSFSKST
jgi:hypothetical protein